MSAQNLVNIKLKCGESATRNVPKLSANRTRVWKTNFSENRILKIEHSMFFNWDILFSNVIHCYISRCGANIDFNCNVTVNDIRTYVTHLVLLNKHTERLKAILKGSMFLTPACCQVQVCLLLVLLLFSLFLYLLPIYIQTFCQPILHPISKVS